MYSDPMPGEEYENAEAREKARLEREAIANGENFNPNLTDEAAAGFENLGDDVPFAGDTDVAMTAAEIAVEGPAVAATDVAVSEGLKLVGDIMHVDGDTQHGGESNQFAAHMAKGACTMVGTPVCHDGIDVAEGILASQVRDKPSGGPGGVGAHVEHFVDGGVYIGCPAFGDLQHGA